MSEDQLRENADCSGDCASCGSDCTSYDPKHQTITITTDDDEEIECRVVNLFKAKENSYIVLLPLDNRSDGEAYLFRFRFDANGNPELENIEDPEEYSFAARVFDNLVNNVEYVDDPVSDNFTEEEPED